MTPINHAEPAHSCAGCRHLSEGRPRRGDTTPRWRLLCVTPFHRCALYDPTAKNGHVFPPVALTR